MASVPSIGCLLAKNQYYRSQRVFPELRLPGLRRRGRQTPPRRAAGDGGTHLVAQVLLPRGPCALGRDQEGAVCQRHQLLTLTMEMTPPAERLPP